MLLMFNLRQLYLTQLLYVFYDLSLYIIPLLSLGLFISKGKGHVFHVKAVKACRGSRGKTPLILSLGAIQLFICISTKSKVKVKFSL